MTAVNNTVVRTEAYRLYQAGDLGAAERLCRTLLQSTPNDPEAIYLLGAIAQGAGHLEQAAKLFGQAAQLSPDNVTMVNAQGEACFALGQQDEALRCFRHAQALRPTYERAHNNLGRLFHVRGDLPAARACFCEAIRLNPGYATAHNNLGAVLQALGEPDAAAASYRQAIALQPNYPEAHFNLGVHFQSAGDPESAIARFQEAVRLRPNYTRAYSHLGQALASLRRDYDALTCYREAARLQPNDADVQIRLGDHLLLKKDWSEAIEVLERACALEPSRAEPMARLAHARQLVCDWRTYESDLDRLWSDAERQIAAGEATSVVPFQALTLPWSLRRQLDVARSHCDAVVLHQRRRLLEFPHSHRAPARLRIGYLSGDFYDHPIAHLLQGLFERHDRSHFEIFAYSFGVPDSSVYRQRIIAGCDHFIEVANLSLANLAQRIAADGIHVLVDLMGHTGVNRLGALALRPAPIQVSFLGMLGTMGADFIDYLIGDATVTPPEFASGFTEKFVIMPGSYFIAEPEPVLPAGDVRRADYGLPESGFVYCSFNNTYKFEPRMFDVWMNILRRTPEAVLWLFSGGTIVEENLRREANARDIDPKRLVFASFQPRPQHLLRHRAADLFLDTLIYNAAATSSLALQAGLPVLTCLGDTFASRVGASLLRAVGLHELIAPNLEEYERRAIELARQPGELRKVREKLTMQRRTAPLYDTPRFVRNLERAYQTMWDIHSRGEPLRTIDIIETECDDCGSGEPNHSLPPVASEEIMRSRPTNDCKDIYLDLLKKCLANTIYGDANMRRGQSPQYDERLRAQGADWPAQAHTMIGSKRLDNLQFCIEDAIARGVAGDLMETGVWRGGATIFMRAVLKAHAITGRRVWAADSFQGLPPPNPSKYPADTGLHFNNYKELAVSLEEVQDNFRRYGLLDDQVRFLKGWFSDTLPAAPIQRLAVLRLDGDLYESTMVALTHLYPKVQAGGYVIIDDYNDIPACQKAVLDYRNEHGIVDEIVSIDWTGVYWKKSD